jgi:predicted PurR-regulated permease PerM
MILTNSSLTIGSAVDMIEQDPATPAASKLQARAKNSNGEPAAIQGKTKSNAAGPIIRIPVDARGLALGILATIVVVFALKWAENFFIPLLLGIFFAYTLNPLVVGLERVKVPRGVGAGMVVTAVVCALALGIYSLRGQMQTILDQLPEAASKFATGLANIGTQFLNVQKVQTAMEKAASQAAGIPAPPKQSAKPAAADQPAFKLSTLLWAGSKGAAQFIVEAAMVIFLVFFLLAGGETFKHKLVHLAGPSFSQKKVTVQILDDINGSIQRYIFMLLVTNALVALLSWIAFRLIGLENAGAWAVAAGLFHLIPYFGPALTAAATGMAAFLQFDTFSTALLVAGMSLAIATVIGVFVTTWMTGKIAKMNSAAVFISLLFWTWLWGAWGLLLGIPIIVIVKVVSEHVQQLQPVTELLEIKGRGRLGG